MKYSFFLEIIAGLACLGFGGSYLYMLNQIRGYLAEEGAGLDNISVLNFPRIYSLYVKLIKGLGKSFIIMYLHFFSLTVMIILIYTLQEMGL